MGKLLIIRNADFSQVAVDVVTRAGYVVKNKLHTDGTAYIDTGIVLGANDVLTITGFMTEASVTEFLYGWRNSGATGATDGNVFFASLYDSGYHKHYTRVVVGGYGGTGNTPDVALDEEHTIKMDFKNSLAYIDNVSYTATPKVNFPTALGTFTLMLFGLNNQGSIMNRCSSSQYIKSVQITRNGTPILDLIPCIYEGVAGMIDRVSDTFFGPEDGGAFTAE